MNNDEITVASHDCSLTSETPYIYSTFIEFRDAHQKPCSDHLAHGTAEDSCSVIITSKCKIPGASFRYMLCIHGSKVWDL